MFYAKSLLAEDTWELCVLCTWDSLNPSEHYWKFKRNWAGFPEPPAPVAQAALEKHVAQHCQTQTLNHAFSAKAGAYMHILSGTLASRTSEN